MLVTQLHLCVGLSEIRRAGESGHEARPLRRLDPSERDRLDWRSEGDAEPDDVVNEPIEVGEAMLVAYANDFIAPQSFARASAGEPVHASLLPRTNPCLGQPDRVAAAHRAGPARGPPRAPGPVGRARIGVRDTPWWKYSGVRRRRRAGSTQLEQRARGVLPEPAQA